MNSRGLFRQIYLWFSCNIIWTPYLYLYILFEILFSFFVSVVLHNNILLYALDGILFFPVFAIHIYNWKVARLFRVASFWGIVKSVVFIAGILAFNNSIDGIVDQGLVYHNETLNWITTGEGIIANPEEFIPLHVIGVFRVIINTVGSCGLVTLIGGSRELNVMNFHVAKLIQISTDPFRIILFSWPLWSLIRGWSYLALMVSSAKLFFIIIRRHTISWRPLIFYTLFGLFGAAVDVVFKVYIASQWRILLLNSL